MRQRLTAANAAASAACATLSYLPGMELPCSPIRGARLAHPLCLAAVQPSLPHGAAPPGPPPSISPAAARLAQPATRLLSFPHAHPQVWGPTIAGEGVRGCVAAQSEVAEVRAEVQARMV